MRIKVENPLHYHTYNMKVTLKSKFKLELNITNTTYGLT